MMNPDDLIQDIIFDGQPAITFDKPPKTIAARTLRQARRHIIKSKKAYLKKRYKPTFKTDLMPAGSPASNKINPGQSHSGRTTQIKF